MIVIRRPEDAFSGRFRERFGDKERESSVVSGSEVIENDERYRYHYDAPHTERLVTALDYEDTRTQRSQLAG